MHFQKAHTTNLAFALGLGPREHVAIVGGGGKTSLMFALAEELRRGGYRVVTTTTTKVWHREARRSPCVMFSPSPSAWHEKLREALETYGHVFVARNITGSAKVEGISPASVDTIYREPKVDYLILEADGSAGHPVKAPGEHEPVIPSLATIVVAMMGLEALGKRLEPEFVFRPDQFEMVTGLDRGERLTANRLARIFQVPEGLFKGAPICARRAAFLNKLDLLPNDQEAKELADLLTQGPHASVDVAVVGSIANGLFFPICRSQ